MRLVVALVLAIASLTKPAVAQTSMAAAVVRAEAAFQSDVERMGIVPAFALRAAPEALMFLPGPTAIVPRLATEYWPGTVAWRPAFIAASRGGDLAISIGPSLWTTGGMADPGYFLTIWRRDGERMQFIVDRGTVMARDLFPDTPVQSEVVVGASAPPTSIEALESVQLSAEMARGEAAVAAALLPRGRILRDLRIPLVGPVAASAALGSQPITAARLRGGGLARSGDFAWAWGDRSVGGAAGHYVRVWLFDGQRWAIAVDHFQALPKP